MKKLGEIIKSIRTQKKLTLAEVADSIEGYDAGNLSRFENGKQDIASDKLEAIARILGYSMSDLYQMRDALTYVPKLNQTSAEYNVSKNEIKLINNQEYPSIKRVNLKLSAGIVGFGIDYDVEDQAPIVMQKNWFQSRGYKPEKLLATKVKGDSMQSGLFDGDTVVINTADTEPADGEVFAINYEGEMLIKRLIRDSGVWWLSSDNPDQRKHPRKECASDLCIIIGKVVHKQSEVI